MIFPRCNFISRCQVSDETDVASKLEDLILQMHHAEAIASPTAGSETGAGKGGPSTAAVRSPSKDLSGTLKNLCLLDRVMTCKIFQLWRWAVEGVKMIAFLESDCTQVLK